MQSLKWQGAQNCLIICKKHFEASYSIFLSIKVTQLQLFNATSHVVWTRRVMKEKFDSQRKPGGTSHATERWTHIQILRSCCIFSHSKSPQKMGTHAWEMLKCSINKGGRFVDGYTVISKAADDDNREKQHFPITLQGEWYKMRRVGGCRGAAQARGSKLGWLQMDYLTTPSSLSLFPHFTLFLLS